MNKRQQFKSWRLIHLCVTATLLLTALQELHATGAEVPEDTDDSAALAASPGGDTSADTQTAWENFVPPPDSEFDWIQLSSGEWLKGKIKTLYDGKLEFKSSDLGTLSLSWDTVKQVRTAKSQTVRFADPLNGDEPMTVSGLLVVDGDRVTVGSGSGSGRVH